MRKKSTGSVTLVDIAKLSHVTVASVSAVLNGSKNIRVSEATRGRILENARRLNYLPPRISPALPAYSFIGIWGSQTFISRHALARRIQRSLLRHGVDSLSAGYSVSALSGDGHTTPEAMVSMGAKGIICLDSFPVGRLEALKVPYVTYGSDPDSDVHYDRTRPLTMLLRHMREVHGKGHPVYVCIHQDTTFLGNQWEAVLAANGLSSDSFSCISLWELEGDADRLFAELGRCHADVVFAQNDHLATRIIKAAQQRGVRVPEDLAVIGYDGLTMADSCSVSLTTAMPSLLTAGDLVVDLMLDRLQGKRLERQSLEVPVYLCYGRSCGCPERPVNRLFTRNTYSLMEMDALENFNDAPENCQLIES